MTQHVKCDYLVMPKIFAPNLVGLFSRVVFINVLILAEITSRIRNWHNAKL